MVVNAERKLYGGPMKRMLKDWTIALLLGAAVFMGIRLLQPKPNLPDVAPTFTVETLDGDTIDLANLRGRPVVLNFWATWCGPCRAEIPAFSRFAQNHPEIPVIGLSVDTVSTSKVRAISKKWGIAYPIAMASPTLQQTYDISTLPTTVVVGPDGKVSDIHVGTMSESQLVRATR
jgi:thiol-disulfide isomerase/thioredoxin